MKKTMLSLVSCLALFASVAPALASQEKLQSITNEQDAIIMEALSLSPEQQLKDYAVLLNAFKVDSKFLERPQSTSLEIVHDQAKVVGSVSSKLRAGEEDEGMAEAIEKFKTVLDEYKSNHSDWKEKLNMKVLARAPFNEVDIDKLKSSSEANTGSGVGLALCTLYCTGYNELAACLKKKIGNIPIVPGLIKSVVMPAVTSVLAFVISKYVVEGEWLNDRPVAQAFIVIHINDMIDSDDEIYAPMKSWSWTENEPK